MAAVGSQSDIVSRLQRWLPGGWFPNTTGTLVYAIVSGFAGVLAGVYSLIAYAKNQTRIATATDGFLDLAAQDFFGANVPRAAAETDTAYSARIRSRLIARANTKAAISARVSSITGSAPRIMEPWNPGDCGACDAVSYLDVDTPANPSRLSSPESRAVLFIETPLPSLSAVGDAPVPALDAVACADTWTASLLDLGLAGMQSERNVYSAISQTKMFGVQAWVKFQRAAVAPVYWDSGRVWDSGALWPF